MEQQFKKDDLVTLVAPNVWADEIGKVVTPPDEGHRHYHVALIREDAMDGHAVFALPEELDTAPEEAIKAYQARLEAEEKARKAAEAKAEARKKKKKAAEERQSQQSSQPPPPEQQDQEGS